MKRYSAQEDGAWVSEFISSRRTTRDFLPTPVPPELIEQILKDSLTAPSWSNTRPFKVAVATGEVRDRISNEFLSRWKSLSAAMRGGIWSKIRLFIKRHGLPTSNRIILKPYAARVKTKSATCWQRAIWLIGCAKRR
jgi:nitroreductase